MSSAAAATPTTAGSDAAEWLRYHLGAILSAAAINAALCTLFALPLRLSEIPSGAAESVALWRFFTLRLSLILGGAPDPSNPMPLTG